MGAERDLFSRLGHRDSCYFSGKCRRT